MKKFSFKAHLLTMGLLVSGVGVFAQNSLQLAKGGNYVDLGVTAGALGAGDFTAESYFRTYATSVALLSNRADKCSNTSSQYWNLIINAAGKVQFEVSQDLSGTNYNSISSINAQNDSTWHHVAVTRKGTTLTMYIDGVQNTVSTLGAAAANVSNGNALRIGNDGVAATCVNSRPVSIDEVRIWGRALSACEIVNNRTCQDPMGADLRTYLKFNDAMTPTADAGSNNVAGTVTGTAVWLAANATGLNNAACTNPVPVVSLSHTGAQAVCQGTTFTMTANVTGATTGLIYQWRKDSIAIAGANSATYTVPSSAVAAQANYTVYVTNAGGCADTAAANAKVTITSTPTAAITPATSPVVICAGTPLTLSTTAIPGATYQWYEDGTVVGTGSTYAAAGPAAGVVTPKVYTVRVTLATCSKLSTDTVRITTTTSPAIPTVLPNGPQTICSGDNVLLTAATTTAGVTYQWQKKPIGGVVADFTNISGATSSTYAATTENTYRVVVGAAGCTATSTDSARVIVHAKPVPVLTIAAGSKSTICAGESTTITESASGVTSWAWSTTPVQTTASITVSPAATTSYTVTITDVNGCKASAIQVITVSTATVTGVASICDGAPTTLTAAETTGVTAYEWKNGATVIGTSRSVVITTTGSYTVKVTHSNGCVVTSAAFAVSANTLPTATIGVPQTTPGTHLNVIDSCSTAKLVGTSAGGTNYEWRKDGVTIPGATLLTYTATAAGSYTFIATNISTGCAKSSLPTTISFFGSPAAAITSDTIACAAPAVGTTLSANTGTGLTYQWYNGASALGTAATETTNAAGSYTVKITDARGCVTTSAPKVLVAKTHRGSLPTVTIVNGRVCIGSTTPFTAGFTPVAPATAAERMTYSWKRLHAGTTTALTDTTKILAVRDSGTYTVMVQDSNRCVLTANAILATVDSLPKVTIAPITSTTFCQGGSVTLSSTLGAAGTGVFGSPTYAWRNNGTAVAPAATAATYSAVASGKHTVAVTDGRGCVGISNEATITVNSLPNAVISGPTAACASTPTTLTASAGGVTYEWYTTAGAVTTLVQNSTSSSYAPSPTNTTTTYTVAVVNAAGCRNTSTPFAFTTLNGLPTAPIAANGPTGLCAGNSVVLTANPAGAAPNLTYQWRLNGANLAAPTGTALTYTATSATPGVYSVVVTSSLTGCAKTSNDLTVTAETAVTASAVSSASPICAGTATLAASPTGAAYAYQWQKDGADIANANLANFTPALGAGGSYRVLVTKVNSTGCASTSAAITVDTKPTAVITAAGATIICQNNSDILNATTTGTIGSYQWKKDGVNIPAATNATAITANLRFTQTGVYKILVTSPNGCVDSSTTISTTVNPTPGAAATTAAASVCAPNTAALVGSAATGSYGFQWKKNYVNIAGANSLNYAAPDSGSYKLFATLAGCIDSSAAIVVAVKALPAKMVTVSPYGCAGGVDTLKASIAPANRTYTYQWYRYASGATVGAAVVGSTDSVFRARDTAAAGTTYKVFVTMDGCVDSSTLTTPAFNALVSAAITAGSATTFCEPGSVTFTAAPATSYQWNKDGAAISTATAATYTATTTGTYSVTSKGAGGCAITTPTGTFVSVGARPTSVITASGPVAFCSGDSVTLNANTGTGLTYVWEKNGAAIVPAETGASYKAKTAGSYIVRVTNANGCSDPSLATVVTLNDATTNTLTAAAPTTVCVGDSVVLTATGSVIGGGAGTVLYQWYNGATVVADSTRRYLVARAAGSYTVKTSLAGGCKTTSTVVAVTMRALPVVTPATTTTFCAGNSVALKTPKVAGATYNWTSMNGAVARVIPVGTDTSYAVTSNGVDTTSRFTYQVAQKISGLTCTSAKTTVSLNANPVPQLKAGGVISVGALRICEFDSVGLKISDAGKAAASYRWSTPYGWTNGSTSDTLTARPGTTSPSAYTVTITNAAGCTAAVTQQLDTLDAPSAIATHARPLTFCAGDSVSFVGTTTPGATTYLWKRGVDTVAQTANLTAVKVSGVYTYTVTSVAALGGCKSTSSYTVNAYPTAAATISGVAAICSGASTTLTAAPTGAGYTYQWYKDGVATAVGATYAVNAAGSYTVVATNGGICSSAPSAATVVTVNTPAVPTITAAATSFCEGGSQVLKASTGTAYQWSFNNVAITTGGTDSTYTANAAGVYTVAVTNASGCVATSATTALTVNALPTASITAAGTTTFCTGGSVVLNANTGTGLTYKWFNNGTEVATTASYTATATGSYTVEVTNASGCKKVSDATAVNANAAGLTVAVTAVTSTTFCQGGNVVLNAPAAASYQWSKNGAIIPGATSGTYVANATGSYSVAVADANSCAGTSAGTAVTVNALPTATITAFGNTTLCEGDNVTLNVSGGTSYAWSTGSTSTSVVASTAGAYSVTVTDANGCTAAATQAVSVNALPVATSTAAGATTFCAGGSVNLNANTGTGLTYQWMNGANAVAGATAATHAATTAGSYTVVVTSTNGCRNTSNATVVTVSAAPVPALTTSRSPNLCPGDNVTLTATGGDTYSWSTGVTTAAITTSAAGTYTVTVTNAAGCTATASQAVVVNAAPLATLTAGGLTSFCPGDNVALSAPVGVNYGYQWLNNGAVISGSMHRVHAANVAGSYTAVVTDTVTGCSSTSSTPIVVTIYARPTVSFTNAVQTGTGSVVDFTNTSTAGTPTWSFGDAANSSSMQQNPTFWYKTNGTYNVTLKVTSANGCVDSLTKTVTVTGARTDLSELQETLQAVAYPNPFTNRFVIEIQNPNVVFGANDRLVVTNTLGQLVHQTVLNQKMTEISTEEWAAGIYNLTIYSNGTVIPMKKVVKMDR